MNVSLLPFLRPSFHHRPSLCPFPLPLSLLIHRLSPPPFLSPFSHLPHLHLPSASPLDKQILIITHSGINVGSKLQLTQLYRLLENTKLSLSTLIDKGFPLSKAEEAFAYLAAEKHLGKVVITLEEDEREQKWKQEREVLA